MFSMSKASLRAMIDIQGRLLESPGLTTYANVRRKLVSADWDSRSICASAEPLDGAIALFKFDVILML